MPEDDTAVIPTHLPLPADFTGNVTEANYPRQLMIYDDESNKWCPTTDENKMIKTDYMAISYRQTDFPDKLELEKEVHSACHTQKVTAFWLDYLCTGTTQEEKNKDLYRIADVFRNAKFTLIMIKGDDHRPLSEGWRSYGDRVWTLPEALLSKELLFKVGSRQIQTVDPVRLANHAYIDREEELALVRLYSSSGKDSIETHEKVELLRKAIWKRSSGPDKKVTIANGRTAKGGAFTAYAGERVYALMGFLLYRIEPIPSETEEEAFRRLKEKNKMDQHKFSWEISQQPEFLPATEESSIDPLNEEKHPINSTKGTSPKVTSASSLPTNAESHKLKLSNNGEVEQISRSPRRNSIKITKAPSKPVSPPPDNVKQVVPDRIGAPQSGLVATPDAESCIDLSIHNLDEEITKHIKYLNCAGGSIQNKVPLLHRLGILYKMKYEETKNIEDVDKAIEVEKDAVRLATDTDEDKRRYHANLAVSHQDRYDVLHKLEDLESSISNLKAAIRLTTTNDPSKSEYHSRLGSVLKERTAIFPSEVDLDDAIAHQREALQFVQSNNTELKAVYNHDLSRSLNLRFENSDDQYDIDEAIESISRSAYHASISRDDANKPNYVFHLGKTLQSRYIRTRNVPDLNKAIAYMREASQEMPEGSASRPECHWKLALALKSLYRIKREKAVLEDIIANFAASVRLAPDNDPNKRVYLRNTADAYQMRYEEQKDGCDLNSAIDLLYDVIHLSLRSPVGDRTAKNVLDFDQLSSSLKRRYDLNRNRRDLLNAIEWREEATKLLPSGSSKMAEYYQTLASLYMTDYEAHTEVNSVDRAIDRMVGSLQFEAKDSKRYPEYLYGLAKVSLLRYKMWNSMQDVDTAIKSMREAVDLNAKLNIEPGIYRTYLQFFVESLNLSYSVTRNTSHLREARLAKAQLRAIVT